MKSVYARVSNVTDWIDEQICRLSSNPPENCDPSISSIGQQQSENTNDNNENLISLTVTISLDEYPGETAWSFSNFNTGEELYFDDFGDISNSATRIEQTFDNLQSGTYQLLIGDRAWDGICCAYGDGGVAITNGEGTILWSHSGDFDAYLEALLQIDGDGNLISVTSHPENTNEGVDNVVTTGIFDLSADTCSFTIDIKTDAYPSEIGWSLENVETGVEVMSQSFGDLYIEKAVVSKTVDALSIGKYKFEIHDEVSDGITNGWITIRRGNETLWTTTGDFYDYLAVHVPCTPNFGTAASRKGNHP